MANPQAENGHVDIANEIMEALAKIRIPGEASQVLFFILRKTYGWHKKEDAISLSQFEKATGLKRPNVCSSIKRLIEMNLIYKGSMEKDTGSPQKDTTPIQVYGFQKDFEKWVVVPKKIPSPQKDTKGSILSHNGVVPNSIHTKETIQKKTNKRKRMVLSDEEWLSKMKELYSWVDWDAEERKIDAWLLNHPDRKKSREFIRRWMDKARKDKPIEGLSELPPTDPIDRDIWEVKQWRKKQDGSV